MTGSFSNAALAYNASVRRMTILARLHDCFPPEPADIIFEFTAEWSVIPESVYTFIDFRALKDKTAPLTKRYYGFHFYIIIAIIHKWKS